MNLFLKRLPLLVLVTLTIGYPLCFSMQSPPTIEPRTILNGCANAPINDEELNVEIKQGKLVPWIKLKNVLISLGKLARQNLSSFLYFYKHCQSGWDYSSEYCRDLRISYSIWSKDSYKKHNESCVYLFCERKLLEELGLIDQNGLFKEDVPEIVLSTLMIQHIDEKTLEVKIFNHYTKNTQIRVITTEDIIQ